MALIARNQISQAEQHDASAGFPRVLVVTGEYPPARGGVGDYTALLARHLIERGASVRVLTTCGPSLPGATDQFPPVQRAVTNWGVVCWQAVEMAAKDWDADIVHIQYQAAAYELRGAANMLPAYLKLRRSRVGVVTTFHDLRVPYLFPKAGPLRRLAIRCLDKYSDRTVVTNQADLSALGGPADSKRWLIRLGSNIANSPPADYDRKAWRRARFGADDRTLVLAHFGFLNESKGTDLAIRGLRLLEDDGVHAKLIVVGGDPGASDPTNRAYVRRVQELISSVSLDKSVIWTGFATEEEVSANLLAADFAVLPYRDGASLRRESLLAAMEHGLPVVTTTPEAAEPLLVDRGNVLMVPSGDARALASTLITFAQDEPAMARLAEEATRLVSQFRWPDVTSRHMEMYQTLDAGVTEGRL